RIEDLKVRVALAERLGLGSKDAGLNRLARITLAPDQINAEQLEQVFGFEATTHDDPLRSSLANSEILTWRLAVTRQQWVLEDSQARDAADGPMPIIDPDLVGEENLITKTAGDPVYDLWKRRKTWLDNKHAEAQHERQQGFDHVIHTFIGDINIAALASRDENGENISDELKALKLDLAAFRSLAKYQKLSASLEDWEWQDILDIAVQVQKKRQYQEWRTDEIRLSESGFSLSPEHFRLPDLQSTTGPQSLTSQSWRATRRAYVAWRKTLALRGKQLQDVKNTYQSALETVEAHVLPLLRDWLIGVAKEGPAAADEVLEIAEELSHTLLIDFRANTTQTTRLNQAIETLQAALLSVRAGRLATDSPNTDWNIRAESDFDQEWKWMASYKTWRAAMMAFAYPENQLYPYLFVPNEPFLDPTVSFLRFIERVRKTARMTAEDAGNAAQTYLKELREQSGLVLPPELQEKEFLITETNDPVKRKKLIEKLFADRQVTKPHAEPNYLFEIFWLVPMALAMQLQKNGRYLTALDWYQTVYAFNLPEKDRKVYKGLELEGEIKTAYHRVPEWLVKELNPHIFARSRKNAYTRFTVMAIVQCFLDYADSEFTQNTVETVGRARTLYETAADLLNLADAAPGKEATSLFLSNPIWEALKTYAHANLTKIRNGMNIAGIPTAMQVMSGPAASLQPSQYRYSVLGERAKQLVSIAQQVESSFLSTMEREEAERYSRLQAGHDLQVAKSTVSLQVLKITDADLALQTAHLQQEKTRIQADYYEDRISEGLNSWEQTSLTSMKIAAYLQTSAGVMHAVDAGKDTVTAILTLGFFGSPAEKIGQALSALADAASSTAGMAQAIASYQRREEEWRHQKSLSDKDVQISGQQILLAQNQRAITIQERDLSVSQLDHAAAVVNFLLNKFLNAELYEWMSGVLGRVYNYFLQQATAIAQLAQSQLAFERQEPALSVIQSDYWQVTSDESWAGQTAAAGPDRRGLTGSARLLQDIYKLDQYAFETKQRKLQLTQTLSLAQMAPLELQIFRDTGKLLFATPMELFDRDFPGHYLRLIRRVRVSVVALVPPTRGVRATLSASGISRVVTSGETFETIEIRRSSETIAFTSPLNATGLFELESDGELLLPFEGMGVDTFWELQLPKAANPFDYRAIADVLLTIEYTALFNSVYRQQVIKKLDSEISSDRMFSLREQFPDAWYDLNNGDAIENVDDRMVATFSTRREDFPPHIEDLQIQEITLLVARRDGFMEEIDIQKLTFTPEGKTD
ncbi:MAG TPA: neuraminidase-like domain-containing protein, partial [Pyrinomonadaceae bacterium]|nr:neuraminidase-like domain-containing protein [Pyrinomonadaceae bacterium]